MSQSPDTRLFDSPLPVKIGDINCEMSMLTDRDYGDITQYIRAVYLAIAYETGKRELIAAVLAELPNIGWGTEIGIALLNSYDRVGFFRVGFQMCRKRHPNLTFEIFEKEARKNEVDSLNKINDVLKHFSPTKLTESEDAGGSSTGNDKSGTNE